MSYELVQVNPNCPKPSEGVTVATGSEHEISQLWEELADPWHFKMVWRAPVTERKQWSETSKGSARRKRLKRRLDAKFPLLSTTLYQEQVLADRAYYEGRSNRRKTQ